MAVPEHLLGPKPREVESFGRAFELGRTPAVPSEPPAARRGISVRQISKVAYGLLPAGIAVVAGLFAVGTRTDSVLVGPAIALVAALVIGPIFLVPRRLLSTALDEARHGYTTVGGTMWTSPKGQLDPYWIRNRRRVEFDFSGLWFLGSNGDIKARPDWSVDPPGFYPSPADPNRYELWTGRYWTGNFVDSSQIAISPGALGPSRGAHAAAAVDGEAASSAEGDQVLHRQAAARRVARIAFSVAGALLLIPTLLALVLGGLGQSTVGLVVAALLIAIGVLLVAVAVGDDRF